MNESSPICRLFQIASSKIRIHRRFRHAPYKGPIDDASGSLGRRAAARCAEPTAVGGRTASVVASAPLPKWSALERAANDQLRARSAFRPPTCSRSEARAVIAKLNTLGWQPNDAEKLLGPSDDDEFMVRRLRERTKTASVSCGKLPSCRWVTIGSITSCAFARRNDDGGLIHNPGGYRLFEYMATAQGGKEMGKMLGQVPHGKDFNDPTGRTTRRNN